MHAWMQTVMSPMRLKPPRSPVLVRLLLRREYPAWSSIRCMLTTILSLMKILTFQFVHTDAVCHGLRFRDWGRVFLTWKDSQVLQLLFLTHHSRIRWAQDHCLCQYLQEGSSSQKPEQVGGPRKKLYVLWCTTVIFVKPCALMLITVSTWHI